MDPFAIGALKLVLLVVGANEIMDFFEKVVYGSNFCGKIFRSMYKNLDIAFVDLWFLVE